MTNRYTTLVIAPKTDLLLVDDEVQQVNNLLGAKLLQGSQATIHGLLEMLSSPFKIVWFATHGSDKGIYLTDGVLNSSEITSLVRSCGAELVVFNTCSSRGVALTIFDELQIPMVCTIKTVPDRMAFITGTIFARKVADGHSFRQAYELAKPGQNSTYLFLPEKELVKEMPPLEPKPNKPEFDAIGILNAVRRLEILVTGDPDYNVEGLMVAVKNLTTVVTELKEELVPIKSTQKFNRTLLISVLILCLVLVLTLMVITYGGRIA